MTGNHSRFGFMSALWPCHVGKIFHSTPSHPWTLAFFLPPLLWCSLSLGVVVRVSQVGLSTQSLIHSTLTRESLHYPLSTAEPDQAFFRTIRSWRPHPAKSRWSLCWSSCPGCLCLTRMCEKMQGDRCENGQNLKFELSGAPRGSSKDTLLGPLPESQWSLGICSSCKLLVILSFTMDHVIRRATLM